MEIGPLDFLAAHLERILERKRKETLLTPPTFGEAFQVHLHPHTDPSQLVESIASRLQKDTENGTIGLVATEDGQPKMPLDILMNAATSLLTQRVPSTATASELLQSDRD